MSNLDFVAQWDIDALKADCAAHRALAKAYPAYDRRMCNVEEYYWSAGDWGLCLMLETWDKYPRWHGLVEVMDVPYRTDPAPVPAEHAKRRVSVERFRK